MQRTYAGSCCRGHMKSIILPNVLCIASASGNPVIRLFCPRTIWNEEQTDMKTNRSLRTRICASTVKVSKFYCLCPDIFSTPPPPLSVSGFTSQHREAFVLRPWIAASLPSQMRRRERERERERERGLKCQKVKGFPARQLQSAGHQ